MMKKQWTPFLTGDYAKFAWERIWEISHEIENLNAWNKNETGLATGIIGGALFFGYLAVATGSKAALQNCKRFQAIAAMNISTLSNDISLFGGFPGIAWATSHLKDMLEPLTDDPVSEMDEILLNHLGCDKWRSSFDLISGLVGNGVYALERIKTGKGREILANIIRHLAHNAININNSATWLTPSWLLPEWQHKFAPNGCWNLGLAHGIPGILALLGMAVRANIEREIAEPLLKRGVRWLLSRYHRNSEDGSFVSALPYGKDGISHGCRIAWCYGDLGVAIALLLVAISTSEDDLEKIALSIAGDAARRPIARSGVCDACVCHGSAVNLLLFLRLYAHTGDPCYNKAIIEYFEKTKSFHFPGNPLGGFMTLKEDESRNSKIFYLPGFLEGNSGIGLVLLSAVSDLEPRWDRLLLASTALE